MDASCGCSSVVERQLPKLNVVSSSLITRFMLSPAIAGLPSIANQTSEPANPTDNLGFVRSSALEQHNSLLHLLSSR
jgi:hypothetical protein